MEVLKSCDGRHRGIFPLPLPPSDETSFDDLSRASRRKHLSRRHVDGWVRDMVCTLNSMYGGSEFVAAPNNPFKATLAQRLSLDRLRSSVLALGKPPEDISGRGALVELQAGMGYSGETMPASLAGYQKDLVSLPEIGGVPSSLETILGSQAPIILNTLRDKLFSPGEAKARRKNCLISSPYVDPILKHQKNEYAQFVHRLHKSNLVEFRTEARECVGVFFVWKKSGKQRMIIDARLSNLWFRSPEKVHLATGSSFSRIQVDDGPPIQVGGVDISDAFYRIELPFEFRDLFALPPITAQALGLDSVGGAPVEGKQLIFPCVRVVPMGWAHALWVCQKCHELVTDSLRHVPPQLRFTDMRPVPDMSPFLHTEYVDNFVALSQEAGLVGKVAELVGTELNKRGLATHPVDLSNETLGWCFGDSVAEVRMTARRLWKLRLAIGELISQGWASGRLIERVVGHLTFAALLRREILSCFQAVYVFIRKQYRVHCRIWPEVVRELKWASSLLPLVRRDLAAPWCNKVHATDASFWGRGVVSAEVPLDLIKKQARWQDRWRFSRCSEIDVHRSLESGGGSHSDILDFELEKSHQVSEPIDELDPEFLDRNWRRVESNKWHRAEPIPVLEGRTIVWLVQHLARSQANHGRRHLIISDSMTSVLALTKGRGNSRALNRVCRQVGALSLACGLQLNFRWVASEMNPADSPSRNKPVDFSFFAAVQEFTEAHVSEKSQSWRRQALRFYEQKLGQSASQTDELSSLSSWEQQANSEQEGQPSSLKDSQVWSSPESRCKCPTEDHLLGVTKCIPEQKPVLPDGLEDIHAVCQGTQVANRQPSRTGFRSCLVDRPAVLQWRRRRSSHDFHCCRASAQDRCGENICSDQSNTSHQRLQKDGARTKSCSSPFPNVGQNCLGSCRDFRQSHGVPMAASDLAPLCPTGGSAQTSMATCGRSEQAPSLVVGGDIPLLRNRRHGTALQNRRNGRECSARHGVLAVDESNLEVSQSGSQAHRPRFPFRVARRHSPVQSGCRRAWVSKVWRSMSISSSPWLCINRSSLPAQTLGRCHEARQMADPDFASALRTRRQTRTGVRITFRPGAASMSRRRASARHPVASLLWLRHVRQSCLFLELYAGKGSISKALQASMKQKVVVVSIDVVQHCEHDLTKRPLQKFVLDLIRSGLVVGVWVNTPRSSWTRNCSRNCPRPLRSDEHPWGQPGLDPDAEARVKAGNKHALFCAGVLRLSEQMGIPIALVHPSTSYLWMLPDFQQLSMLPTVSTHVTDCCQDNSLWRKRTRFMCSGVDFSDVVRSCCSTRGICSQTCKPHLAGQPRGKQASKRAAQPYPLALRQRIAIAFASAIFEFRARPYMHLLGFSPL